MKKMYKYRLLIVGIFSALIIFAQFSLNAASKINPSLCTAPESIATVSSSEHQKIVADYINQISTLHNRIFQLVQITLDTPPKDMNSYPIHPVTLKKFRCLKIFSMQDQQLQIHLMQLKNLSPLKKSIL